MKEIFLGTVLILVFVIGGSWIIQGNEFFLYKYFGPKVEDTRREIFEQSKAYNQGMIQELQNMRMEYVKASPEHKEALESIILHRISDYDMRLAPSDLKRFVEEIKKERY